MDAQTTQTTTKTDDAMLRTATRMATQYLNALGMVDALKRGAR